MVAFAVASVRGLLSKDPCFVVAALSGTSNDKPLFNSTNGSSVHACTYACIHACAIYVCMNVHTLCGATYGLSAIRMKKMYIRLHVCIYIYIYIYTYAYMYSHTKPLNPMNLGYGPGGPISEQCRNGKFLPARGQVELETVLLFSKGCKLENLALQTAVILSPSCI